MTDEQKQLYQRADAIIQLANSQLDELKPGRVSASTLFAAARLNAWVSALGFPNAEDMKSNKAEKVEFFIAQYRAMLEENYDDYVLNFTHYMGEKATI